MDGQKITVWLNDLLARRGPDILRAKGIIDVQGEERRLVFQAVHMILEGDFQRPWTDKDKRYSRMVFIGRDLDEAELKAGFEATRRLTGPSLAILTPEHRRSEPNWNAGFEEWEDDEDSRRNRSCGLLGLAASVLVWLLMLPLCAVAFVLVSAFGPRRNVRLGKLADHLGRAVRGIRAAFDSVARFGVTQGLSFWAGVKTKR